MQLIEFAFIIYLKFTSHLWHFTFFCFSSMCFAPKGEFRKYGVN